MIKENRLTCEKVDSIFRDCLLKRSEVKGQEILCDYVFGQGIISTFAFNTERLEKHGVEIDDLISQLPDMNAPQSFLTLCRDKSGSQWGEHPNMEQLVALGIASGRLEYPFPKEMWFMLPGGVPTIKLRDKKQEISNVKTMK